MSLFESVERSHLDAAKPLAARMRPRSLDEFVGQGHVVGDGAVLRRMIEADRLGSVILVGPPGCGKTSLARVIANSTSSRFAPLNAAAVGVKEIRVELNAARDRLAADGEKTVLFVDELHRFNKAQQDVLLPDIEEGVVTLVGATTANPHFALVGPLLSRSTLLELRPIPDDAMRSLLKRALADEERGLGGRNASIDDDALAFLVGVADGDARRGLTGLEVAVLSLAGPGRERVEPPTTIHVTLSVAEESVQRRALNYDGTGDEHYNVASAFIKSMRGSDPDATVYWMALMLEAGDDPRFVARRIVICAAEDVGLADPQALVVAQAAASAVEFVGMPEGRIILSQAALYVATAPKSNACYKAIDAALADVRQNGPLPVPRHLLDKNSTTAKVGGKEPYRYAHDYPGGWVAQDYLVEPRTFWEPTGRDPAGPAG
ncbi:MAG: replication-associated recombination protein A [Planctomycetota bacterium]